MTEEKPAAGNIEVRIAGTEQDPTIELEFFPEVGLPIGIRMKPEGALIVASELAKALEELGWIDLRPLAPTRQ